jgi:hypothetical protein
VGEGGRRWHAKWWLGCPEEGEKARVGRCWVSFDENKREWGGLLEGFWAQLTMGCRIDFKDLDSKTKRLKHFKQTFNWIQNRIKSKQLFRNFSNLEIWNLV